MSFNRRWKRVLSVGLMLPLALLMMVQSSCTPTQERADKALQEAPVPESGGKNDFRERKSIIQADQLRNRGYIVFFAYQLADDGQLVDQWTCLGSPVSSTESVEPNNAGHTGTSSGFRVKLEGDQFGYTSEMMGIDGTYGDPAPFFFCITPGGHYEQWSIFEKVRVTTIPRSYPERVVRIDEQQVIKVENARRILQNGGCVDDNLNQIDCAMVNQNLEGGK